MYICPLRSTTGTDAKQRQSASPGLLSDAIKKARDEGKTIAVSGPENDNNGDSTTDESDRDSIAVPIKVQASLNDTDLAMRLNDSQHCIQPGPSTKFDIATSRRPVSGSVPEGHLTQSPGASPPEQHSNLGREGSYRKASSPIVNERNVPLPPTKPKHKLGKIGGKAKESSATPESHKGSGVYSSSAPPIDRAPKGPDPVLDGVLKEIAELGKPAVPHNQGSPGKVSEEQANENRKRLQHDLERMSKAATKKKRKF